MRVEKEFFLIWAMVLLLKGSDAETQVVDIDWTGEDGEKTMRGGGETPDQGVESTGKL